MTESHVILAGSRRPSPAHGVRLRDVDADTRLDITVTLKGPDLPPVGDMPAQALSREEVERRFGVPHDDLLKVERALGAFGLRVRGVRQGGRSLRLSGPASAVEAAFKPRLGIYQTPDQGKIRAREGELSIPAELSGLVTGVYGIDQRRVAQRHRYRPAGAAAQGALQAPPLAPADLRRRYNFPSGQGAGQRIAIAEFGDPQAGGAVLAPAYIGSDVEAFCVQHGLSTPQVVIHPLGVHPISKAQYDQAKQENGPLFSEVESFSLETMMDVQIVAGLCPQATIDLYFAPWSEGGWVDLIDEATSGETVPVALSISYGLLEEHPDWSHGVIERINHRLQLAALRGVTVCVSSGDDGAGCDANDRRCHTEFPASSPFVLAVGGTQLDADAAGNPVEVVWRTAPGWRKPNTGGGATGGGVSRLNTPKPPWQTAKVASLNPGASSGRIVPDVAALAGSPFYDLIFDGERTGGGGTSASTPLWASLIALVDASLPAAKRQRFWPPLLYKSVVSVAGFRDVTHGDNASTPNPGVGYQARAGFDAVTGWGVPNGQGLAQTLAQV